MEPLRSHISAMRAPLVGSPSMAAHLRDGGPAGRDMWTDRRASKVRGVALLGLAALTFTGCGASASMGSSHIDANAASRSLSAEAEHFATSRQVGVTATSQSVQSAQSAQSTQSVTPSTATLATADVCVAWGKIEADLATGRTSSAMVAGEAQSLETESAAAAASDPRWKPLASAIAQWKADLGTRAALTSDYDQIQGICHGVPAADLIAAQRANNSKG